MIKGRTREYAVIIRGYRDKAGKVRHKTVQNLGVVTDKNREELLALGRQLISHREGAPDIRTGQEIEEVSRQNWGAPAVVAAL